MVCSGTAVAVAIIVEWEELVCCDGASVATRSVLKGVPCLLGAGQGLATTYVEVVIRLRIYKPARFRP